MNTKRFCYLLFMSLLSFPLSAQTQQKGMVKTRGRMVNGVLQPGVGLQGAIVQIKDRSAVKSENDGQFVCGDVQFNDCTSPQYMLKLVFGTISRKK